jgi:hypothetical protein
VLVHVGYVAKILKDSQKPVQHSYDGVRYGGFEIDQGVRLRIAAVYQNALSSPDY